MGSGDSRARGHVGTEPRGWGRCQATAAAPPPRLPTPICISGGALGPPKLCISGGAAATPDAHGSRLSPLPGKSRVGGHMSWPHVQTHMPHARVLTHDTRSPRVGAVQPGSSQPLQTPARPPPQCKHIHPPPPALISPFYFPSPGKKEGGFISKTAQQFGPGPSKPSHPPRGRGMAGVAHGLVRQPAAISCRAKGYGGGGCSSGGGWRGWQRAGQDRRSPSPPAPRTNRRIPSGSVVLIPRLQDYSGPAKIPYLSPQAPGR